MARKNKGQQQEQPAQKPEERLHILEGGVQALDAAKHAAVDMRGLTLDMLPPVIRSAKDVAGELAEKIRQGEGIAAWMATTLQRLEEFGGANATVQAAVKEDVEKARMFLNGLLGHKDPVIRRGVYMTLLQYKLGQKYDSHEACDAMFEDMEKQGWLVSTRNADDKALLPGGMTKHNGPATIYGRTYNLPANVVIGDKDVAELRGLYEELRKRTMQAVKADRQTRFGAAQKRVTITPKECGEHAAGICLLEVPQQKSDGKVYQGGWLLVQTDGHHMRVIDVVNEVGHGGQPMFERSVREQNADHPKFSVADTFAGEPHRGAYRLSVYLIEAIKAFKEGIAKQEEVSQPAA